MKWFENVEILKEMLKNNEERLEEVEYNSEIWNLLTDENSLIKHHLELIKENQELKKPKFDLSLLDNAKKIEVDYNEKLLEKIKILEKENLELKEQRLGLSLQLQDYRLVKEITLPNVLEENEKLKKAIEIILKYEINLLKIKQFSYEGYVGYCNYVNLLIPTQQEYELLKEVLDKV